MRSQTLQWVQSTHAVHPADAYNAQVAFDEKHGYFVFYGGPPKLGNQTWILKNNVWSQFPNAKHPGWPYGYQMVYDSARGEVVLHGGSTVSTATMTWNGSDWVLKTSSGNAAKSAKYHAMAYDSFRKRLVSFGGTDVKANFLKETWEWDGAKWIKLSTATSPDERIRHAMAYDPIRRVVVLFGGNTPWSTSKLRGDTWTWDGVTWKQWSPKLSPSARCGHSMAFDPVLGRIILFGGDSSTSAGMNDMWSWNGSTWVRETPATVPPGRQGAAMATSFPSGQVLLFGGGGVPVSDYANTWRWESYHQASASSFGAGCGTFPGLRLEVASSNIPLLGERFDLKVKALVASNTAGLLALGVSRTHLGPVPLPLNLGPFGMKGCQLLVSMDVQWVFSASNGVGSFSLQVPYMPALKGQSVFFQAIAQDKTATTAGLATSNGLEARFGYR